MKIEQREQESRIITQQFPDRIPVIVEKKCSPGLHGGSDQCKYLVPYDLTVSQFQWIIRRKAQLDATKAIYLTIGLTLPNACALMGELYYQFKDNDGFLYVKYGEESTFGCVSVDNLQ